MSELGVRARDMITGFTGIITGRSEYLFSYPEVYIEPEKLDDQGKPIDGIWFREARVEILKDKVQSRAEAV